LGAAVGHACWHRQLGHRKALIWGAGLGTLPDVDVLLYPFLDDMHRLYWHRGESHSIWFSILGSMGLGCLLGNTLWRNRMSHLRLLIGLFLVLVTHISIDVFTIYGTQLLAPFSRFGFANGNMFIIDPLYTGPLLIGIFFAFCSSGKLGIHANWIGVALSTCYALFSLGSHAFADRVFRNALAEKGVEAIHSQTSATPMNTLLWRHLAKTEQGLLVGYFSVVSDLEVEEIKFEHIPQNQDLVLPYMHQPNFRAIDWFSKGFWVARQRESRIILSDLRFGEFRDANDDPPERWHTFFNWDISSNPQQLPQPALKQVNMGAAIKQIWYRIWGGPSNLKASSPGHGNEAHTQ